MKDEGLDYGQVTSWMGRYGVLERVTRTYPRDNVYSRGRKSHTMLKRKPGVSPLASSSSIVHSARGVGKPPGRISTNWGTRSPDRAAAAARFFSA